MSLASRLNEALFALAILAMPASIVLASTALTSTARADVIPEDYEPPECPHVDCPAGTSPFGMVGHGSCGRGCYLPRECGTPESCDSGTACGDTRYCVLRNLPQGRMISDTVVGACAADGSCAEGECMIARRCLSTAPPPPTQPPAATSPGSSGGCAACAIAPGAEGRAGLVLGAMVAAVGLGALARLRRALRRSQVRD